MTLKTLVDLIKYPIITDKATKLLEINQYTFAVDLKSNKLEIKTAIEYLFNVTVLNVNTLNQPKKKKTIGRFSGYKARYKKAIVTLKVGDNINLFPDL
jgi:large subunit ribosomal protein L23